MVKLAKMMSSWKSNRTTIGMAKRLGEILFFFYFIAHIAGCAMVFTNFAFADEETGKLPENGWIARSPLTSYAFEQDCDKPRIYLLSIYWAFATLTTVGYGDIAAWTTPEVIVATMTMYIGTCILGFVVGNVTTIVMEEDRDATQLRERVDELGSYMRRRGLSVPLMERVREHYDHKWKTTTIFDETAILEELPSFLRDEVIAESYVDLVRDVPMLASLSPTALSVVIMALKPQRVLPTQVIVRKGGIGSEMFIVASGLLKVHDSVDVFDPEMNDWTKLPFRLNEKEVAAVRKTNSLLPGVRPPKSMRYAQADYHIDVFSRGDYFGAYCLDPIKLGSNPVHDFTVVAVRCSMLFSLASVDFVRAQAQVPDLALQLGAGAHSADHGESARLLSWDKMSRNEKEGRKARMRSSTSAMAAQVAARVALTSAASTSEPPAAATSKTDDGDALDEIDAEELEDALSSEEDDGAVGAIGVEEEGGARFHSTRRNGARRSASMPEREAVTAVPENSSNAALPRTASWSVRVKNRFLRRGQSAGSNTVPDNSLMSKLDRELGIERRTLPNRGESPATMQQRERRWGFLIKNMDKIVQQGRDALTTSPKSESWATGSGTTFGKRVSMTPRRRSVTGPMAVANPFHADHHSDYDIRTSDRTRMPSMNSSSARGSELDGAIAASFSSSSTHHHLADVVPRYQQHWQQRTFPTADDLASLDTMAPAKLRALVSQRDAELMQANALLDRVRDLGLLLAKPTLETESPQKFGAEFVADSMSAMRSTSKPSPAKNGVHAPSLHATQEVREEGAPRK